MVLSSIYFWRDKNDLVESNAQYNILVGPKQDNFLSFLNVNNTISSYIITRLTLIEVGLIALVFGLNLSILVVVQIGNIILGKTTKERFGKKVDRE